MRLSIVLMNKIIFLTIWTVVCNGFTPNYAIAQSIESTRDGTLLSRDFAVANNIRTNERENLTRLLIFGGLVGLMGTIGWQLSRKRSLVSYSGMKQKKARNKALIDRVSPRLRRQLLRLINDPKTANRLLMGIYQHNRNRDPDWVAEKAIYDLRRGR